MSLNVSSQYWIGGVDQIETDQGKRTEGKCVSGKERLMVAHTGDRLEYAILHISWEVQTMERVPVLSP